MVETRAQKRLRQTYTLLTENAEKTHQAQKSVEIGLAGYDHLIRQSLTSERAIKNRIFQIYSPDSEEDEEKDTISEHVPTTSSSFSTQGGDLIPDSSDVVTAESDLVTSSNSMATASNSLSTNEERFNLQVYETSKRKKYVSNQELSSTIIDCGHPVEFPSRKTLVPNVRTFHVSIMPDNEQFVTLSFSIETTMFNVSYFRIFCYIYNDYEMRRGHWEQKGLQVDCGKKGFEYKGQLKIKSSRFPNDHKLLFLAIKSFITNQPSGFSLPFVFHIDSEHQEYKCDYKKLPK